ncbi:MAG TPA: hypothetical protein VMD55_03365 [Terracidiphilus sp.]|nr:hypothetical protein [Terracidiphilus sp.]
MTSALWENRTPWEESGNKLLSWWDMEKFSAATFQQIVSGLTFLLGKIEELPPDAEGGDLAVKYIPAVAAIRAECEKLALRISIICANDFISSAPTMTLGELTRSLRELDNTIRREMQACEFFYMPFKQTRFYRKSMLFGARVAVRFPATDFDIAEAGNCFAMGRGTACVFHLMRVMEVGVQTLGAALGVQLAGEKNWQNILDEINKAIKGLPPKAPRTVAMSQIAAHLYNVKVAWRNQVMHPHDKYTMDEAEDLLGHVESFMKTLAELVPMPKQNPPAVM